MDTRVEYSYLFRSFIAIGQSSRPCSSGHSVYVHSVVCIHACNVQKLCPLTLRTRGKGGAVAGESRLVPVQAVRTLPDAHRGAAVCCDDALHEQVTRTPVRLVPHPVDHGAPVTDLWRNTTWSSTCYTHSSGGKRGECVCGGSNT